MLQYHESESSTIDIYSIIIYVDVFVINVSYLNFINKFQNFYFKCDMFLILSNSSRLTWKSIIFLPCYYYASMFVHLFDLVLFYCSVSGSFTLLITPETTVHASLFSVAKWCQSHISRLHNRNRPDKRIYLLRIMLYLSYLCKYIRHTVVCNEF